MTAASGALGRQRPKVGFAGQHPELAVGAAILAAWVLLLVFAARMAGGASSAGMPGMPMPVPGTAGSPWSTALATLPSWLLMTVAMMGPAALGKFRELARAGLATLPVTAAFSVGYLAVWTAFGLLAEAAAAAVRGVPSPQALALCLAAATAWQLTPLKCRVLHACLGDSASAAPADAPCATSGCAPREPAVSAGALRRGFRFGLCCVGTCWCLMLIPLAAPGGQLPWMAGLTILVTAERLVIAGRGADPRAASRAVTRTAAAALTVAAVATLAVSGLLQ